MKTVSFRYVFECSWLTFHCDGDGHAHKLVAEHVVLSSADSSPAHDVLTDRDHNCKSNERSRVHAINSNVRTYHRVVHNLR